jgi:RHS repeat-associated protein
VATGRSSARPADLAAFAQAAGGAVSDLQSWITKLTGSYMQFQASGSMGYVTSRTAETTLPALVTRQQDVVTFVDLVRAAFESADSGSLGNGMLSVSDTELQSTYEWIARHNGLDPATFDTIPAALTVPPVLTGAIPETSGFVDDPVCTATGHFLEDEVDLAVPERLAVLAWPRRYSSRLLDTGPFGRGWFTWASARLAVDGHGDVAYRGPDGRQLTFAARPGGDGWARVPGIGAQVAAAEDEGLEVVWDTATTFDQQRWHFDGEGRPATIWGPTLGTTTLHHDGDRLVRMVHEGGRALHLRWRGDRVVEARLSDGRAARYTYDERGDLTAVERPDGGRRYEPDDRGRILAVHDADDVRLCRNTYDDDGRVLRQVSPLGRETIFEYLPGRITRVSDTTAGPVAIYEHDPSGRVTGLVNAAGDRFERVFDDRGRVVRQRHFDGTTLEREATSDPGTIELRNDAGRWARWRYDDAGRLVAQESDDRAVTFGYEGESSLPARITGPDGATMTIAWDRGLPVSVTDADGVRIEIEHDADGCAVRVVNALGLATAFEIHPSGKPAVIRHADGTEHRLSWDDAGRLVALRDPTGAEGRLQYSPAGRVLATIDPEGGRTEVAYGPAGYPVHLTDALGRRGEVRFDVLGNLVGVTEPNGGEWSYAWSALGQLSRLQAPDGSAMAIARDAEGRPTAVTDPAGHVRRVVPTDPPDAAVTTYTPAGRIATVTDGSGRVTTYGYDAAGRIARVTTPGGGVWRHELDGRDRVVAVVSPEGRRTVYGYDGAGRLALVEDRAGRRRFDYDGCGRVVAVVDALGAATRYRYDAAGQLVAATDPRGATVGYRYDAHGDQVAVVDPLGSVVETARDGLGRPVAQRDALGRTTAWTYDIAGRPTAVTLATGEQIPAEPPTAPAADVVLDRDGAGRVTTRAVDGRVEQLDYDDDGWQCRVVDSRFGPVELARDRDGLLTDLTAAGLRRAWRHDEHGRVVEYREATDAGERTARLRRDALGRVVEVHDDRGVTTYDYDPAGQLVGVRGPGGDQVFTYDAAGRLIAESGPRGSRRLRYDAAGQLVGIDDGDTRTIFSYDAAGRRVAESGSRNRSFRWGAGGSLEQIVHDGRVTRVGTRAGGELAAVDDRAVLWDTTSWIPRPWRVGDADVLTVAGQVVATASRSEGRRRLPGLTRLDASAASENEEGRQPVSRPGDEAGRTASRPGDEAGRTAASDDPDGAVTWCSADWRGSVAPRDVWGRPPRSGSEVDLALGFGGEVEVGGLVWLRHRVLDPITGQFLSRDPLSGVAGSPVATFPYHYAGNDPVGFVDPLGLRPISIDQYDEIRRRATDVQWGNIATALIVVAGVAVTVCLPVAAPLWVGLAVGAGFGAASGAAPYVANAIAYGDDINWATMGKDMAFGAAFGALGGGVTKFVPKLIPGATRFIGSWAGEISHNAATGFLGSVATELYDVTSLPGSKRDPFEWEAVMNNTLLSGGGAALGKGITAARGGPGGGGMMPDTSPGPLAIEPPPTRLAIEGPPPRLAIEGPPPRPAIEGPPARLAIEPPPTRLAIEGPPARLAIEGPPVAGGGPLFSSPPEVQAPMPDGPHGSPELEFSG